MSDHFRYFLRVRYGECDAQKVVFNARYGDYVDLATSEFFRALGFEAELASGEFDFQLVKQTFEWKAPARYDQVLEVTVKTQCLGNTSFTLLSEFRVAGQQDAPVIVTAETVYVTVAPHSLTKTPIPLPVRAAMERGANVVTDHAGYFAGRQAAQSS